MPHHSTAPAPDRPTPEMSHRAPTATDADRAVSSAGRVAGAALTMMAALAGFGVLAVQGLVTPGDAAATARDISASEGLFRLGVASLYVVIVLDVVAAWALMRFLSPVSRDVSRLAGWLRLTYAGVFMVAVSQLAGVGGLLDGKGYAMSTPGERQGQVLLSIGAFHDIWAAGLVLFGAHLLLVGHLAYRSGYVPRVLGVLLVIAGVGYGFDSFVAVLSDGSPFQVSTVTFLGELLLGLWLLVRGHRISARAR